MHRETERALRQIPKELSKLNKIIAAIGKALAGKQAGQLRKTRKELEDNGRQRPGIS